MYDTRAAPAEPAAANLGPSTMHISYMMYSY